MTSATTTDRSLVHTAGALLGLLLVLLLVVRTTQAAFSDTTSEATDYAAATVELDSDVATSSTVSFTDMVPGDVATSCFTVDYTGSTTNLDEVRLYAGAGTDDDLDADLDAVITQHDSTDCSGTGTNVDTTTIAALEADHTDYDSAALASWTPSATPETVSYEVEVTLGDDTPNTSQGLSGATQLTWEVRTPTS